MAHECKEFKVEGRPMWLHLQTDTSNVLLEKKARAFCWTGPSPDEVEETSPQEAIAGTRMRLELHHHNMVEAEEGENVASLETRCEGVPLFHAVAFAKLTLPNGKVIAVEARA